MTDRSRPYRKAAVAALVVLLVAALAGLTRTMAGALAGLREERGWMGDGHAFWVGLTTGCAIGMLTCFVILMLAAMVRPALKRMARTEPDASVPPSTDESLSQARAPRRRLLYALAAIPAGFLPLCYVSVVIGVVFLMLRYGPDVPEGAPILRVLGPVGIAGVGATLVQWPVYIVWAATSRELSVGQRVVWILILVLLNMFAMPWFLYCKYRGTTSAALALLAW